MKNKEYTEEIKTNEYIEDKEYIENSIIDNEIIAHLIYSNNI